VIGGKDLGFRHPATIGYLDPAIALTRGRHTFTLNVPLRIYMNYPRSYSEIATGLTVGGGLPTNMILVTYSLRFGQ
jgi:hypothetical protein